VAYAENVEAELATVFEANDAVAISLAKGLLEQAGVPFLTRSNETEARLALGPILFPTCRFLVPRDWESEARKLLEQLAFPLEAEDEEEKLS
jgi:hypothetical protein